MTRHVFLCYSAQDEAFAYAACRVLQRQGMSVSLRSGGDRIDARDLTYAQVVVLIFSSETNRAPQIQRWIELAIEKRIAIVGLRVEYVRPEGRLADLTFSNRISIAWVDALSPPYERHFEQLAFEVERQLRHGGPSGFAGQRFAPKPLSDSDLLHFARSRGARQWGRLSLDVVLNRYGRVEPTANYAQVSTGSSTIYERSPAEYERASSMRAPASRSAGSAGSYLVTAFGAVLACGAAIAFFRNRHEIGAFFGWLAKSISHSSMQPAPAMTPDGTIADVSVYAPACVVHGETFLVQVFTYDTDEDDKMIAAMAEAADPATIRRGVATLNIEISKGDRLDFTLDAPGLAVEDGVQSLIWRNKPRSCGFQVSVPENFSGSTVPMRVRVFRQAVPIGQISFSMSISEVAVPEPNQPRGDTAPKFRRVFLSYSSSDRAEVIKRAQALRAARVDFFNDLLSLEPGERWEQKLYKEIESCDLFLLFWSQEARESIWIKKEIDHALACHREILPIILEGPPPPKPPESLSDRHFNDPLLYVIAAVDRLEARHPAT